MVLKMIFLCIFILFDVLSITSGRSVEGGKDADVLIVGGGISGLAAAGRLEKAGLKVIAMLAKSMLENAPTEHPWARSLHDLKPGADTRVSHGAVAHPWKIAQP